MGSAAYAQGGTATGAATGAIGGAIVGGPVGAVVGGVAGATVGGMADTDRTRFGTYVQGRHLRSYDYNGDLVVGTTLPARGVTYYAVPAEYKMKNARYAVVNNRTVLVEPKTRRIVQIIE
jgi:hypothetical protein